MHFEAASVREDGKNGSSHKVSDMSPMEGKGGRRQPETLRRASSSMKSVKRLLYKRSSTPSKKETLSRLKVSPSVLDVKVEEDSVNPFKGQKTVTQAVARTSSIHPLGIFKSKSLFL